MPWLAGFEDVFAAAEVSPTAAAAIDDPIIGRVSGRDAIDRYRELSARWPTEADVRSRQIGQVVADGRAVGEFEVRVDAADREVVLPVALVVDAAGRRAPAARVYLSAWPLTGERIHRKPLLAGLEEFRLPAVVDSYLRALSHGDPASCVRCYEPDGRLQGAGGPAHAVRGVARLRSVYEEHLASGGIVLEPCSITSDASRIALEFTLRSWAGVPLDQAGLSVYVLGPTGRIAWNRVYDDAPNPKA